MKTYTFFILILGLLYTGVTFCQDGSDSWELINNENGLKIYTRLPEDSKFKELKILVDVPAPIDKILDFIGDEKRFPEWIYTCSESYIINQDKDSELYYIRFDMMWPLSDRDLVQRSISKRDPDTGIVDIYTRTVPGKIPKTNGVVRIEDNTLRWKLTPVNENLTSIYYHAKVDPAGIVPAWIMNMVVSIGPKKTMLTMIEKIKDIE